ncbi:Appr-1-p processing protein [Streptomyces aidingensis]|uniref:Macro domain-containing protein n=1 Tax=Streptomyces aidingensis TaxID=910347 RepID=A0A1I1R170_9ACTN|nr:Appr-1-p processing protein [Streptomyces aidingensis]SFD25868.1 hypothetical protein SAMN05421773_11218 [Streptomyces aidingensis]
MRPDTTAPDLPTHAGLTADLTALRRPGLAGLRRLPLPALRAAAVRSGHSTGEDDAPAGMEALIRDAVRRLGGEEDPIGRAAARSFGLLPGQRGASAAARREAAASVYRIVGETFRRQREEEVFGQLAEAVLMLCRQRAAAPPGAAAVPSGPGQEPGPSAGTSAGPQPSRSAGVRHPRGPAPATPFRVTATTADGSLPFELAVCPAELLRDVDVLVSSENVYLEMSKTFHTTLSASLRRAAAVRDVTGELVDDVLARELAGWMRAHARPGLPVRPGTVAPTSSGALAERGIRRIYHAAVAAPLPEHDTYRVEPETIVTAVGEVFARARAERDDFRPPLRTICFPLLGAGRGGLAPADSAAWLAWAIREQLAADPRWQVQLVVRRREVAQALTGR